MRRNVGHLAQNGPADGVISRICRPRLLTRPGALGGKSMAPEEVFPQSVKDLFGP